MSRAFRLTKEEDADSNSSGRVSLPFISYSFALVMVACTIWSVDMTSPALPEIKDAFGLSAKGAGLIVSFLFIGRLIGNLPAARLLDSVGSPTTASIGGIFLVVGASINALAPTVEVLYLGRVLQGTGIALLVNAGLRSIVFAKPARGAAMTRYGIAVTIGGVLGLQSGGFLTGHFGWQSIFVLSATLGVLLTILPMISTRVAKRSARPDAPSASTGTGTVPVRTYLAPLAVNFLIFMNYSIWVVIPLYAQEKFDASPEMTANLLLIITITHLVAAVPVARGIRRFGAPKVLSGSVLCAVIGSVSILLATSVWQLAIPLMFYGAGMVGAVNCAGDIVLHRGGAGSKAVGALRQTSDLGLVIGPIMAGALVDALGYSAAFFTFPIVMLGAAGAGLIVPGVFTSQSSTEAA